MKDALFHPKVWLFENGSDVVAAHGSSNVTYAGIRKNIEQIAISRSWQDANQRYITDKLGYEFGRLWENKDDNCLVIGMPEAVRQRLLRTYSSETPSIVLGEYYFGIRQSPHRDRYEDWLRRYLPLAEIATVIQATK